MDEYLNTIIGGIIGLIGVVLGFFLQLFSSHLFEIKRVREEFSEIKSSIYSITIANNFFPELLRLNKFFVRYPKFKNRQ